MCTGRQRSVRQVRGVERACRRGREGGRLQRTARESLSEGPGRATGRGPRAGGRKVAAIKTVQLMRASTVIDSIVSDSGTNDAEVDSRKPKRPTLRLMIRAPSVEAGEPGASSPARRRGPGRRT